MNITENDYSSTYPGLDPSDDPRRGLLRALIDAGVITPEEWAGADAPGGVGEAGCTLDGLVRRGLLTGFQAEKARLDGVSSLIVGPYRVLDLLGAGGMGTVFKAEHLRLRRTAALKVMAGGRGDDALATARFEREVRALARLDHPNIAAALDAGEAPGPGPGPLRYLAMEYVPGPDLEGLVSARGPLPPGEAAEIVHQVASALDAAHRHGLVHRDVKPSNVRMTADGRAKLLDFGIARPFGGGVTEPGSILGTLDYLSPEQARAEPSVDIRADLYGLGGTLFWCLTGRPPFPGPGRTIERLLRRRSQAAPSARAIEPSVPGELDAVLSRLMSVDPDDRYATPEAAMRALAPFLASSSVARRGAAGPASAPATSHAAPKVTARTPRILLVDDEAGIREVCRFALEPEGFECAEAADGESALLASSSRPFDLVLLDVDLPGIPGTEVCRRLRADPPASNIKIVMVSGHASGDEMARMLSAGADDYLAKPFGLIPLQSRVLAAWRHKESQDRAERLNQVLLGVNHELEQSVTARDCDLVHARNALVLALAKLAESRDNETGEHLLRLQRYSRALAEEASRAPAFSGRIDASFVATLECCVPLHDIGKVALPDHILRKPGPLDAGERIIMQSHAVIGADTLRQVADRHGFARGFLQMAVDIARHHHERHDGRGYPDRLSGADIPLAARIVAVCDVYDALRSRRVYKPAMPHRDVLELMGLEAAGQFDPAIWSAFLRCEHRFEEISRELAD